MFRIVLLLALPLCLEVSLAAPNKTPDYYKCESRVGGSWKFGRAPYACNADTYGEDSYLSQYFGVHVFDDSKSITQETRRYMSQLYATLMEVGKIYFALRESNPDPQEQEYFLRALLTIAHQESFWSHYRKVNNRFKLMRGDFGHGHGLMQIDDRWHFVATEKGIAWHLIDNLTYALDEYYQGWQRAETASCVSRGNLTERVRAAYSSYNGGPSKICRFKNTRDRWYRNDKAFYEKWQSQSWRPYVVENQPAPIPVRCHILKQPCDPNQVDPNPPSDKLWANNQLYKTKNNGYCISDSQSEKLYCQSTTKNIVCLKGINRGFQLKAQTWDSELPELPVQNVNPLELCPSISSRLQSVGQNIELKKNINLRKSPGGSYLTTLRNTQKYEVLDFQVQNNEKLDLYYRVTNGEDTGYIYSGNFDSYEDWVRPTSSVELNGPNQVFKNVNQLTLLKKLDVKNEPNPSSSKINEIDKGENILVENVILTPPNNHVFYELKLNNQRAYLQAGQILPESDLLQNVKPTENEDKKFETKVQQHITYEWLRTCPDVECSKSNHYIVGKKMEELCKDWGCQFKEDQVSITEQENEWSKVILKRNKAIGWSKTDWLDIKGEH